MNQPLLPKTSSQIESEFSSKYLSTFWIIIFTAFYIEEQHIMSPSEDIDSFNVAGILVYLFTQLFCALLSFSTLLVRASYKNKYTLCVKNVCKLPILHRIVKFILQIIICFKWYNKMKKCTVLFENNNNVQYM